ncbi:quinate permease [Apiospora aurea]|uniref:Quinate permease n=1 Tax=Apiospora aurea TaxID=335848 RepID=A0ABR1PWD3_9PEZI
MGNTNVIKATKAAIKECPSEIFNFYLIACVCIWSFSGVAKGFDEGRKFTFQILTLFYIAGVLGQTFSGGNLAALYASRVITGMGIGATTAIPSVYIAEIAPQSIRGLLTVQYACCQQLGVVFGFFINYGVTKSFAGTQKQWMLPTALQLVPAVTWLVGCTLTPETPRFLLAQNKRTEVLSTLVKFRRLPEDHPYVRTEFTNMEHQLNLELEVRSGSSFFDLVKETFGNVENRRRSFLMFFCHIFGQWSGANGITQYSPTILGYLGISNTETSFLATGIYAIVKFVSVLLFSLFMIDFIGRRRSLMTGISLQIFTLAYIGTYLGVTNGWSAERIENTPSAVAASRMAIVAIYFHAIAWSISWFSIPYLVSAEIFPLRIRSLNVAVGMAVHWANYFGCSRAMQSLLVGTDRYGAFVLFCSVCAVSLVYVFFAMPETAGRSLESMEKLFEKPWYKVYEIAYPKVEDLKQELRTEKEIELDEEKVEESAAGRAKHVE